MHPPKTPPQLALGPPKVPLVPFFCLLCLNNYSKIFQKRRISKLLLRGTHMVYPPWGAPPGPVTCESLDSREFSRIFFESFLLDLVSFLFHFDFSKIVNGIFLHFSLLDCQKPTPAGHWQLADDIHLHNHHTATLILPFCHSSFQSNGGLR